jgi:lipopolysaccharide transport system ATP-binding protein
VIVVENLSKRYRIRQAGTGVDALRDTLTRAVKKLAKVEGPPPEPKEFWALDDVHFRIDEGEAVAVLGRNGAGKSTLLKVLSRVTEPTKGRVRIRGRVASMLEVGTGFHPELTGRENVYLNGAILGMSRAEIRSKMDSIIDFSELGHFIEMPVKRYSSGMHVKLGFSIASHVQPDILIADEVLAVGDAAFQLKCITRMRELVRSEGHTVLFVSHNMSVVQQLCSRSIWLDKGQQLADGPTADVVTQYQKRMLASIGTVESYSEEHQIGIKALGTELLGGDLRIRLQVVGEQTRPAFLGIEIESAEGIRASSQEPTLTQFRAIPGETVNYTCRGIDRLLTPGAYLIHLWIMIEGRQVLRKDSIMNFVLPPNDPYHTGKSMASRINGVSAVIWERAND